VLLLVGATGMVEGMRAPSGVGSPALERQLLQRGSARFDSPCPDGRELKTVHSGLLVCAPQTACSVVLDLPVQ
jgi:hypothetical protein